MTVRILNADVMDGLSQIDDCSVQCVVTSPPYWGLRDYGVDGQIGLEDAPEAFLDRMVEVFREVRRVLAEDGVCWVNLGDSYAGGGGHSPNAPSSAYSKSGHYGYALKSGGIKPQGSIKPKDLVGIPWRCALALQSDGWWLRRDIIWSKPNPMPESVTDRCTSAHEYIFMLTKSARYYYDAEAVREPATYLGPNGQQHSPYAQGVARRTKEQEAQRRDKQRGHSRRHDGFNDRWDAMTKSEQQALGRNKRSVWTIATKPFSEAHFATFPPELPEICIKASTRPGDTVLDPFGGAGTTGLVADRLQRNAILIELNPEYAAIAERRINGDRGALLDAMEAAE